MQFETLAIHTGMESDPTTGSVVPPLYSSTIFRHPPEGLNPDGFSYTRHDNPNRNRLEQLIARMEGASDCAVFSSGVAAATAIFQAMDPGDEVLAPEDVYHGNRLLLNDLMRRWGLYTNYVDMTDPEAVDSAITNRTRLIWVETPSNPLLHVTDIKAVCKVAAKYDDLQVCVDNTWLTPYLQQPLSHGADLVLHSTTKYLGGHSDLLGGAVISRPGNPFFERIQSIQHQAGAVPSPHDCWMLQRSIHTLPCRMEMHCSNALKVASFLEKHSKVEKVYYPGLQSSPYYNVSKKQARNFGGMLSFLYNGTSKETQKVVNQSRIIIPATSLGGVESTWEHRRSSEGPKSPTPDNLIRLSVGLEHPDDLLADIEQALNG